MALAQGRGDGRSAATFLREALGLAVCIGSVIALCGWFGAEPLIRTIVVASNSGSTTTAAGNFSSLVLPAASYLRVRALVMPFALAGMVAQSAFLAWKRPVYPLFAMAASAVMNLAGDIVLCQRYQMGCFGAGVATAAAQFIGTIFLLQMLSTQGNNSNLPVNLQIRDNDFGSDTKDQQKKNPGGNMLQLLKWPGLRRAARFGRLAGPICFVLLTKTAMYGSVIFFTSSLGTEQLAAHVATYSVFIFFAVVGDSTNQAAQAYLPARLHNVRAVRKLVYTLLCVGFCVGLLASSCSGGMLYFFPQLFTKNNNVINVMRNTVPSVSFTMLVHAMGITAEGMLMAVSFFIL